MAITPSSIRKKLRLITKRPTLFTVVIVLLSLAAEWYEHYLHPIAWQSSDVKVIDGDTIKISGINIRLQGIDTPELKQVCYEEVNGKMQNVLCGRQALSELQNIVLDKVVECTNEGQDKYKRQLSYCYVEGISINRTMVKAGYARSYRYYDLLFIFDELYAMINKNGLWANSFEEPWEWRKNRKRS